MKKTLYYVNKDGVRINRLAKFDGSIFYGWKDGKWEHMPSLVKIHWDVTADYEEITELEAMDIIKTLKETNASSMEKINITLTNGSTPEDISDAIGEFLKQKK